LSSVWRFLFVTGLTTLMLAGGPWRAPSATTAGSHPVLATPVSVTPLAIAGDPISLLVLGDGRGAIHVVGERGLYRSTDGGAIWRALGPAPPAPRIAVAADETLLLAGSRSPCRRVQTGNAPLFRSQDGGASWQAVAGVDNLLPLALWGDPVVALGATCAGLQLSADNGQTWGPLAAIPADLEVVAFAPARGADGEAAFFVVGTAEGGTSVLWLVVLGKGGELVSSQPLWTFWGAGAVGGSRERPVIGTANGVLASRDGGISWRLSRAGLEEVTLSVDPTQGPIPDDELRRGYGISAVAVDADDPDQLYAGSIVGVYRSRDGGATWTHIEGTTGVITALILTTRGTLLAQSNTGVIEYRLPAKDGAPFRSATPAAATPIARARQTTSPPRLRAEAA
jgi:hypothetical protein